MPISSEYIWHVLALMGITLPTIAGYNVVLGKGKILHFGQEAQSLIAAYAIFLTLGATGSYLLGAVMGILFALLLSLFFAWLSFRLEPDGLGILTLACHLALLAIVLNWTSFTRGALGIPQIPRLPFMETTRYFAIIMLIIGLTWTGFLAWLLRGSFGRKLEALAEQEWNASSLGIERRRVHLLAFLLSGLGSVIGNIFSPAYLRLLHPSDYGIPTLLFLVMIVVAGKPGSMKGMLIALVLVILLKESLRFLPLPIGMIGPLRVLLFGVILLAAVFVRRKTLFPPRRAV